LTKNNRYKTKTTNPMIMNGIVLLRIFFLLIIRERSTNIPTTQFNGSLTFGEHKLMCQPIFNIICTTEK